MNVGIICARGAEKNGSVEWINQQIKAELQRFEIQGAYSCLMNEADYLMARLILQHKLQLVRVFPAGCSRLSDSDIQAPAVTVKHSAAEERQEHLVFYEAGERLVNEVDILIAVWNNLPRKGCLEIANLVAYAKVIKKTVIQLNPANRSKKILKKW